MSLNAVVEFCVESEDILIKRITGRYLSIKVILKWTEVTIN